MALPPIHITQKTVKGNFFSKHDNRHSFQNSGVYFGQGLGKRQVERGRSQHLSENHTSWELPTSPLASTYTSDYLYGRQKTRATGTGVTAPSLAVKQDSSLLRKFHVYSKHSFHRFPHTHKMLASLPPQPSLSRMAEWFHHTHKTGETTAPTPLVVLAESQKPFLPHNPWTYS